jgi:hypothetical protein
MISINNKARPTMKNKVNLLIMICVFTMSTESYAQTFGVKAGFDLSKIYMKDSENPYINDYKMKPSFHVGATAEISIIDKISFETGIFFSSKGFIIPNSKYTIQGETVEGNGKLNLYYLDIPFTVKTSFYAGNTKFFGAFGPYLGIGLIGKYNTETTYNGTTESENEDVKWGSTDSDNFKRLDFGLTVIAGVEIKNIAIGITYSLGLANISPYGGNHIDKNRVLGITMGYKFGAK